MNAERWRQIEDLFLAVIDVDPGQRETTLARGAGGDPALRAEVEHMLSAHARASSLFESPAFDSAPRSVGEPDVPMGAGQRIGRYTLRRVLGAGGMGVVWEADQERPRRSVALKIIRPGLMAPGVVRRFEHEAETLARLQHPGIAQVFEAGTHPTETGTVAYFAMELVRGELITEYFRKVEKSKNRQVEIAERLELFVKVCEAVEHAHQRGVIHRDLKPSNILVADGNAEKSNSPNAERPLLKSSGTPDPSLITHHPSLASAQPKVLDFGVARTIDSDVQMTTLHTEVGQLIGTIPYMSPEQIGGRPEEIDTRSDVYSLGVVLYELVSGRLPYDLTGKLLPEAARIIREQEPTPLRAAGFTPALSRALGTHPGQGSAGVNPAARLIDTDLETIVGKALEKEPARRYASVSQLASDITHYLRNEPIAARPPSTAYQLRKLIARHKAPFLLAVVLFLAVVSFAVIAAVQAVRISAERDKAVAARQREAEARASAEEVAAFLENLFKQANPYQQETADPKVRDLLEAGVARLDAELADQPLVYARLALTLGKVYIQLADFQKARNLLESSLAIRQRELGEAHPDVAKSLVALADVFGRIGEPDRSHDLLLKALEIRRVYYGEPHEEVAAALTAVGTWRFYVGDYAAAADYLQQSLDMSRALGIEDRLEIAQALHNLGHALTGLRRLDEAEQTLLKALEMKRRLARPDVCPDANSIALTLEALAHIPYERGDFPAAEQYLAEQVEAYRRGCPPPHIAYGLRNYAVLVDKNRGPAAAEPIFREALAIQIAAFGEQHPEVAATLDQLARVRLAQDDLVGALELRRKVLEVRRAALGENHDMTAYVLGGLGEILRRAGHTDEAEAALLEAHAILTGNHGEHSNQSRVLVEKLIALYDEQDQCDLADEWRTTLAQIQNSN